MSTNTKMPEKAIVTTMPIAIDTKAALPSLPSANTDVISDLRSVPIDKITIDPTQPRKTFNQEKMDELIASVRKDGILQSLLLRPSSDGYFMLVFGERRLRAARSVGLKEVPASIREISDSDAKRFQLIENLQREDVHSMEQAKGFLDLIELGRMDHLEIANQIGKSIYFVRQHLKLNNLSLKWQSMFLKNGISLTTALQICTLPEELQNEFYAGHVTKEDEKSANPSISLNTYMLNNMKGDLATASFDLNDPELDRKMGACTSCQFNSALSSLFAGEETRPKCSNGVCFKRKTEMHFRIQLSKAKEDPSIILVYEGYSMPDIADKLKNEGAEIFRLGYGDDCKEIQKPEKPNWERFFKIKKTQKLPEKKIKLEFEKVEALYESASQTFEKKVAVGKYKRAFIIHSNSAFKTGHYCFVEITPKENVKIPKKKITEDTNSVEDIENEIKRIQQRQPRLKELDQEKIHRKIVEAVNAEATVNAIPKKASQMDTVFIHFLLIQQLSFKNCETVKKTIKSSALWNPKDIHQFKNALRSLSKVQVSYLIRQIVMDKYITHLPNNTGGYIFRMMAEDLNTVPIADFENQQKEISNKRTGIVEKSLAVLKDMKKEVATKNRAKRKQKPSIKKSEGRKS